MTIVSCERCGKQTAKVDPCNYCNKKVCFACMKSMKKASKTKLVKICKTCWCSIRLRTQWKSA
ncbi:MAG: hypothetical protein Q7S22_00280 [Candidatus Micrarchaeota archaeon]|nr:hypothetical protein [Candidatus Micrarchaeota archaeon]